MSCIAALSRTHIGAALLLAETSIAYVLTLSRLQVRLEMKLISSLCILTSAVTAADAAETRVVLAEDGKASATIVIAAEPTPAADLAAMEVQHFIEKITGAKLPISDDRQTVSGNRILIGESRHTRTLGLDVSGYHQMESLVKFCPDAVVLLGRDDSERDCRAFEGAPGHITRDTALTIDYARANGIVGKAQKVFIPGIFDRQGTLRATYRFLEDWCGVRFFGPNPINIHTPEAKTLTVAGDEHHHRSGVDTKSGALGIYGRRSGESEYGPRPTPHQHALYSRRIRWGGEPWYVNHTFQHFNYKNRFIKPIAPKNKSAGDYQRQLKKYEEHKRDFEKAVEGLHPEGNSHQFCYTTDALIKQICQDARDFFDGRLGENVDHTVRNLQGRSNTFFLVPFDVGGYCKCEDCKPLQDTGRGRAATDFNTGESSDYVFSFVNAVAREVAKTHPAKFVGTLAYEGYYWQPKSFEMERNVTMTPCMHTKFWGSAPQTTFRNELGQYKEWVKLARDGRMGPMGMWNYDFDVPRCATAYYAHKRGDYVKMFLEDGIRHVFHCGAPPMLEMYVTNQLYEKPGSDTNALIDDFFVKYFGPAARPMKELQLLLEDFTSNPKYRPLALQGAYLHDWVSLYEHFLTDEHLIKLRALMNEAKALTREEPYASRLEAWDRTLVGRYEKELPKHFAGKAAAEKKATSSHRGVAPDYITGVTASPAWHWYSGVTPGRLVDGVNMVERKPGQLGTKQARLDPTKPCFRWNSVIRATGAWIFFDLGAEYQLDEVHVWNYNDRQGNTQHGMKSIEIAYARGPRELLNQNWAKLPNQALNRARKEGKDGADTVIGFKGRRARYITIHTLGNEGQGNWAEPGNAAARNGGSEGKNRVDAATGMGGVAFEDREFSIGLGQVRFYGKPLQLPRPRMTISDCKLEFDVPGYAAATVRYTLDGTMPAEKSLLYRAPIAVSSDVVIRARAFGCDMLPSGYVPVHINIGSLAAESAARKSLTDSDVAGIKGAFLSVDLHDSDIGPYLKQLQINGQTVAPVPQSKKNKFDPCFINLPDDKLGSIRKENCISFAGGSGDAYKLRNVTLYIQLPDGSWVKSDTDRAVYCSQSKRHWVHSEGNVMDQIEMQVSF